MASSAGVTGEQGASIEVFPWLKALPLAPEYHPTLAEFQDPIAYIFKIEKEASMYGICKIVPPVPAAPKKTAITNLNRSLAARCGGSNPKSPPTFTTRQQQIGFCPRKHRPVQKPVWQSGENYTLPQFEAKAKAFERNYLKKNSKKGLSPLEIETLYWKASLDKPFSVEYANDVPGSAFAPVSAKKSRETGEAATVADTAWNMRGVSRAKGSLLRFMKEEIPGVTSPMVYVAMIFSWFAWHVEDHDLHSLNYLHTGAGKTWYGVPRDAAFAFEEVIRVHGYGGEINPLVTFSTLGQKTTVMSPEVLISAGIPCCRLVQNVGEFVVTFPRAYHSGFSLGFNCGEAANIATPGWLKVAKDAAIRRASINCPPMVSHYQLLYDLALSLCSRIPKSIKTEPRSSRLKDKQKGEGETVIKESFVEDVMRNNDLLHILGDGSSIVLLPQNSLDDSSYSKMHAVSRLKGNAGLALGLCDHEDQMKASETSVSEASSLHRRYEVKQLAGFYPIKGKFSTCEGNVSGSDDTWTLSSQTTKQDTEGEKTAKGDKLSDQGLFSCVTCGILSFACVAIVQPKEAAASYLMSADYNTFNKGDVGLGLTTDGFTVSNRASHSCDTKSFPGLMSKSIPDGLFDIPIQSTDQIQTVDQSTEMMSTTEKEKCPSALGLLALTYGNSSDSEEEEIEADVIVNDGKTKSQDCSPENRLQCDDTGLPSLKHHNEATDHHRFSFDNDDTDNITSTEPDSTVSRFRNQMNLSFGASNGSSASHTSNISNVVAPFENSGPRSDEDSSRLHVFCLQHAAEVEQQLRPIGGAHIMLLCHPDYPELEAEAKLVAEELGIDYIWKDIAFREATPEDEERIQSALESEEGIHGNGDWAVKLGINLYYSASLSRSPLYSKQMPYNSIIYKAFGRSPTANSSTEIKVYGKGFGRQKKIVMAGKWCGKVWMSNQVHPMLAERDTEEEEERSSNTWAKPEVKQEMPSESTRSKAVSLTRKTGNKRKHAVDGRTSMKANKRPKRENPVNTPDDSLEKPGRKGRNKLVKSETPQPQKFRDRNKKKSDSHIRDELEGERNKKKSDSCIRDELEGDHKKKKSEAYIRDELEGGPSTRLRRRTAKPSKELDAKPTEIKQPVKPTEPKQALRRQITSKKANKSPATRTPPPCSKMKIKDEEGEYPCDMEGCTMSFGSKHELALHKKNVCPVKGCGKKFFSHKYLVQHRRVHMDDRPLKCPWKGCKMTFKWAWARTEHMRVHTGERPYICGEAGCGQTFRFVSDFSRHKRKTGHLGKKGKG
ncbi:[Histone H3]-lysine-36 demethylase [Bertholletia excelsa]